MAEEHLGEFRLVALEDLEKLQRTERQLEQVVLSGSVQLRALREEVVSLKKVLEFYADRKSWRPRGLGAATSAAAEDRGRRARSAVGTE